MNITNEIQFAKNLLLQIKVCSRGLYPKYWSSMNISSGIPQCNEQCCPLLDGTDVIRKVHFKPH